MGAVAVEDRALRRTRAVHLFHPSISTNLDGAGALPAIAGHHRVHSMRSPPMFARATDATDHWSRRRVIVGCALMTLLVPVGMSTGAGSASAAPPASPISQSFAYPATGSFQAPGSGTVTVTVTGGSGAFGLAASVGGAGGAGGLGQVVTATLPVTGGEQFDAYPGAAGDTRTQLGVYGPSTYQNLGGGAGGVSFAAGACCGGAGGAASAVVDHASGTFDIVAAGGGGGGAGGALLGYDGGAGGNGDHPGASGGGLGGGAGGAVPGYLTGPGQSGLGTTTNAGYGGAPGGGGGGIAGGEAGNPGLDGGGGGGGGAGGQSLIPQSAISAPAAAPGNGSITFAFTPPSSTITMAASTDIAVVGSQVDLTAVVTSPPGGPPITGTVSFQDTTTGTSYSGSTLFNGRSTATADLSTAGLHHFTATYSGDQNYPSNTSQSASVQVTAAAADISPTSLTFPAQTVNTTSSTQNVTLTNTGNAPLDVTAITTTAAFRIVGDTCPAVIAPAGACTLSITYRPTAIGAINGTVKAATNIGPVTVPLSGTGITPQTPSITSVSPYGGYSYGGTQVTLTGTQLAGATTVRFGSTPAAITGCTATTCTVTAPPASQYGPVDVRITTPAGTTPTSPNDEYHYFGHS